jgi:hypothetical protein
MEPTYLNADEAVMRAAAGAPSDRTSRYWLYAIWAAMTAGLMVYAETRAFTDDEGFHVLAAQLVSRGLRPYLDFCFPQTPLNTYWTAFWMRLFGDSWHTAHALSSLEASGAVMLAAHFILVHFPERSWRVAGAIAATMMIGCNTNLVEFGPLGQAYGICLFTSVCAFRLAVAALGRPGWWRSAASGALAGAAVASSLLSAPVAPVLLAGIWWYSRAGNRWAKAGAFAVGAAAPSLPVFWLFVQSPWVVWFNVAKYHLFFRTLYYPKSLGHDLEALTAWTIDPQSLLLGLFAIFGVVYIIKRSGWSPECRAEFYLCGWLVLGITAELAFAHPTFTRYFCLLAPFTGILAIPGLFAIGSRSLEPDRPFWPVLIVCLISAGSVARNLTDHIADTHNWPEYEDITRKLVEVTPPGKAMFTEEPFYFLLKRRPPVGFEFQYSHKLNLPPDRMTALHIVSEEELKQQLAAGVFASAATCDDDYADDYALETTFQHKTDLHGCSVFWGWKPPAADEK